MPLGQDLWEVQKDTCSAAVLMDLATRWRKRGAQTFPLLFFPTAKCGPALTPRSTDRVDARRVCVSWSVEMISCTIVFKQFFRFSTTRCSGGPGPGSSSRDEKLLEEIGVKGQAPGETGLGSEVCFSLPGGCGHGWGVATMSQ